MSQQGSYLGIADTFVPRANHALKFLKDSWNAHPLSIEKNRSSEQLWILWKNIQKGELCTYEVSFIVIPQVKRFHFFILNAGLCGDIRF